MRERQTRPQRDRQGPDRHQFQLGYREKEMDAHGPGKFQFDSGRVNNLNLKWAYAMWGKKYGHSFLS